MPKCKDCGFFAVWHIDGNRFEEAPQHYRELGKMTHEPREDGRHYLPRCFMQVAPIMLEVTGLKQQGETTHKAILNVIDYDRPCSQAVPWKQGYSAKEHREMIDREILYGDQKRHNWYSLAVACLTAIATVIGIVVSANINLQAARIEAEAQDRAAMLQIDSQKQLLQMQIDSQKEASRQVQVPELKRTLPKKKNSNVDNH